MTYATVQQQLDYLDVESSAAEVHGQLCGLLSVCDAPNAKSLWFTTVLAAFQKNPGKLTEKAEVSSAALAELDQLYTSTYEQLESSDLDFSLLLQSESSQTLECMRSLADWCGGFVFGFGMGTGGRKDAENLPDDTTELIEDFQKISRFDCDDASADDNDQTEADLVEIEEFVRVGVLLIREEMLHKSNLSATGDYKKSDSAQIDNSGQSGLTIEDDSGPTLH